ncbi:HAD-like domain-containing protein [Dunaliella salina]|uniref:HAD-like domain-containing protein n=1 Tax=Dunaliella salina TaxID=3046 RepID=A0ABQ7GMY2_DUNSA|nr:HAD-like domain-containing protein [Dunaliella salina]|eukprot:KAF5835964.1 HAD-like domain-containing protein [Dunaliella salina]
MQILDGLHVGHLFDAIIISAEVGVEKPNRCIFEAALEALGIQPEEAVHVGDDRRNDLWGARDAGVHAWLWGPEGVSNFADLATRVIHGSRLAEWDPDD